MAQAGLAGRPFFLNELTLYRNGLKCYRRQEWEQAELQFLNLERAYPERTIYRVYQEHIGLYRANPPGPGWDGVFTHLSK